MNANNIQGKSLKQFHAQLIALHTMGERITYTYSCTNKFFNDTLQRDSEIPDLYYFECMSPDGQTKNYYFKQRVVDMSGIYDCDVRYTYIPIKNKPITYEELIEYLKIDYRI